MEYTHWLPGDTPWVQNKYSLPFCHPVATVSLNEKWEVIVGIEKIAGFSTMDEAKAKADEILKDI